MLFKLSSVGFAHTVLQCNIGPIGVIVSEETAQCALIHLFYFSSPLPLDSFSCNVIGHLFVML